MSADANHEAAPGLEESIIGLMLLNQDVCDKAVKELTPEDFTSFVCQEHFKIAQKKRETGQEFTSLSTEIFPKSEIYNLGTSGIDGAMKLLKRRRIIKAITTRAYLLDPGEHANGNLEALEVEIKKLKAIESGKSLIPLHQRVRSATELLEGPEPSLEWIIEGLWIADSKGFVAGNPSVGKTWIVLDMMISCVTGRRLREGQRRALLQSHTPEPLLRYACNSCG